MDEPNAPNHWQQLVSSLGIDVPAEEPTRPRTPEETRPPQPARCEPSRRQPAKSNVSGWDQLGRELGLPSAPAAQPAAPPAPPAAVETDETTATSDSGRSGHEEPLPNSAEESPNFFDEQFDFSEPYDVLEPGEPSSTAAATESIEDGEKRPRRRRHRRRRGRDSKRQESREAATPVDEPSQQPEAAEQEPVSVSTTESELADAESTIGGNPRAKHETTRERRSKRRRPRHKKKGRGGEEEHAVVAATTAAETAQIPTVAGEADEHNEFAPSEQLEDESTQPDDESRSAKVGFRGIPTWDETIGLIVSKNLESRAKRPAAGGTSRGRGSPRNQRGGRRRS